MKYYAFQLHTHTLHSDGAMSPKELVRAAKAEGLRGIAVTDHNTATGVAEAVEEGKRIGVIVIPGIEWTTFYGHLTVIGGRSETDWRTVCPKNLSEKLTDVTRAGDLCGVAHPYRVGYPICTGGADEWGLSSEAYSAFDYYEAWSYLDPANEPTNRYALNKYYELNGANARLAAVYGRDWHEIEPGISAATYIGIEGEPTADKALKAIKDGNTYVSTGISFDIIIKKEGKKFRLGSVMNAGEATADLYVRSEKEGVAADKLEIKSNREKYMTVQLGTNEKKRLSLYLQRGMYTFEIYGFVNNEYQMVAFGTPIYVI